MPTRVLVVAHGILGHDLPTGVLKQRAAADGEVFVVVPAALPSRDEAAFQASEHLRAWPHERTSVSAARWRLHSVVRALRQAGCEVDGEVGDPSPIKAVAQLLAQRGFDEIVVLAGRHRRSRWLAVDLAHRMHRRFGLPVTYLDAPE